jgi:CRISPR-associated endoribonuclease Cas6
MRLRVTLAVERSVRIPIDHHDLLRGVVYHWLSASDEEFAQKTHDEGYVGGTRNVKLFTFSLLRIPRHLRRLDPSSGIMTISPGSVEWWISSPIEDFLKHEVQGLLTQGQGVRIGDALFRIAAVEAAPSPVFSPETRFTFSEAVRRNLIRKYELLHGKPPTDDTLTLEFAQDYVTERRPTKLRTIRGIQIRGVEAPLTLRGSTELMQIAWECGLGEKNGCGFGMIEVSQRWTNG